MDFISYCSLDSITRGKLRRQESSTGKPRRVAEPSYSSILSTSRGGGGGGVVGGVGGGGGGGGV